MNEVKNPNASWYVTLMNRFERLMESVGVTEDAAAEIKTFMLTVAREQYMSGNKSGIRWARTNP